MPFEEEIKSGDRVRQLVALRDKLATQIEVTDSARDISSLAARLQEVLREIDELPTAKTGEANRIADRRKRRKNRD